MSQREKGAKKNMEVASASSTEHRILILNTKTEFNASSFENCEITLNSSSSSLRIAIVYRRPPSKKHKIASGEFFDQFSEFLEKYADGANRLRLLLASFNFAQHVTEPTHTSVHTLDLVITPRESTFLHSVCTSSFISDHAAIHCDLDIQKQPPARTSLHLP